MRQNMRVAVQGIMGLLLAGSAWAQSDEEKACFERAAKYSKERGGLSILVQKGGKVIFEQYQNGHRAGKPVVLASGTKSFWGVAAMVAIEDGVFTLDEKVCETIHEWKRDSQRSKITVRHLLTLSSGLASRKEQLRGQGVKDKFAYALQVPCDREPGTFFRYGPVHYYAFGAFLKRKLKEDPLVYLRRKILDPIGMKIAFWNKDAEGNPAMPAGAWITAREWVKFGQLVKNRGSWNERKLIGAEYLDQCFEGSNANPSYGLTWWLNPKPGAPNTSRVHANMKGIPGDLVYAAGKWKQRLFVIRSLDLVVVRQGKDLSGWSDEDFLNLLLGKKTSIQDDSMEKARQIIKRLDKDRNGKLSKDELRGKIAEMFNRIDRDGDGFLSDIELGELIRRRQRR